jgi:DNA helicase-4
VSGILNFIKGLFSTESDSETTDDEISVDGEAIIKGTESTQGVVTTCDELTSWQAKYADKHQDFLTVEEALKTYQRAQGAIDQLTPLLEEPDQFDPEVIDAAETLSSDLQGVCEFIEARDSYNEEWIEIMKASHGDELNSYFEADALTHTDQQFRAIFANDNFNRVNAAAGTGKTTTFGRRVNFILSEYDDVAASDLLAITFTRNGVSEMETELRETFDITGAEVSTINSWSCCKAV